MTAQPLSAVKQALLASLREHVVPELERLLAGLPEELLEFGKAEAELRSGMLEIARRSAAALGYISWPRWRRAEPVAKVNWGRRSSRFPAWIFQGVPKPPNHEAGSGRPTAKETLRCVPTIPNTHRTAASISTPDRSSFTSSTIPGTRLEHDKGRRHFLP